MNLSLYPEVMWNEITKKKKYIPRRLRKNERLKLFKRYWLPYYGAVKVKDVFSTCGVEYYQIIYNNGNMVGVTSFPVEDKCYELLHNFNNMESYEFINKKKPVYGAEIKYWFIINNIDFSDDEYSGFLDKLQYLDDSTKYITRRNKKKKEYEFIEQK